MMRSMTGYGQASADGAEWRVHVTARGVNHRFLDVVMRLPEYCRSSEGAVQRLIGDHLARGRVELAIDLSATSGDPVQVELRADVASALSRAVEQLARDGVASGEIGLADLVRLPGVVEIRPSETPWDAAGEALLLEAIDGALDQLVEARQEEGARLEVVVRQKVGVLRSLVDELERLRPEVQLALTQSMRKRLAEVLGDGGIEPERQAQEAALLVDRSNVSEELERLAIHLGQLHEILGQPGPIGKRLDFLVQEIFRELNTLSAKCRSSEMTRICVDGKVLCEELREQLRNVE